MKEKTLLKLLGFLLLPGVWVICADWVGWASPQLLPPLRDVLMQLEHIVQNGSLAQDLAATLYRWSVGFSLGALGGVVCGLILGLSPRLYRVMEFPIEFMRAMPVTAIFPLFLIVFGIGDESKIAMAFLPTFLMLVISAAHGVHNASKGRILMAQVFGASWWQVFHRVVLFETLPQLVVGLRLGLSLSLIVSVVSEMFIGSEKGLGQRIYDSYLTNDVKTLYAVLIVLGCMGYGLNKMILKLEKKFVFWAGRA